MAKVETIAPARLTAEAFAPFGEVVDASVAPVAERINAGHTLAFRDLARIEVGAEGGRPRLSLYRTTPKAQPLRLEVLERHPLSSQTFYPLSRRPWLVVVAPPGEFDRAAVRVFRAGPGQGVNYRPGTWHHYSLALHAVSDFLVIEQEGPGENCDEVRLDPPLVIALDEVTS
ncbi:MAG: ureidoglycolate lyase [Rhodothalassiaceae bacterium]